MMRRNIYNLRVILFICLFVGCGFPDDSQVITDFNALFFREVGKVANPVSVSVSSGEGDSQNTYKHIKFDAIFDNDAVFDKGWLKGISVKKGQKLSGGEVVILYQKDKGSKEWIIKWHQLNKVPR